MIVSIPFIVPNANKSSLLEIVIEKTSELALVNVFAIKYCQITIFLSSAIEKKPFY